MNCISKLADHLTEQPETQEATRQDLPNKNQTHKLCRNCNTVWRIDQFPPSGRYRASQCRSCYRLRAIHANMLKRCYDESSPDYPRYGARGITVYKPWHSFQEWFRDFGRRRPGIEYSQDRIDNDGSYEPGNVRWIHKSAQQDNTRDNVIVSFQGFDLPLSQACRCFGVVREATVRDRLKRGWELERALLTPLKQNVAPNRAKPVEAFGVSMSQREWARLAGMNASTLNTRIRKHNWPIEIALLTPAGKLRMNSLSETLSEYGSPEWLLYVHALREQQAAIATGNGKPEQESSTSYHQPGETLQTLTPVWL